jgi:hypothetical protein
MLLSFAYLAFMAVASPVLSAPIASALTTRGGAKTQSVALDSPDLQGRPTYRTHASPRSSGKPGRHNLSLGVERNDPASGADDGADHTERCRAARPLDRCRLGPLFALADSLQ